jgi:hypothetical protein
MSDSTPNPTPTSDSRPVWWLLSALFHALLLTWLVLLAPTKGEPVALRAAGGINPAQAKRLQDKVAAKQAESLAASVRDLQNIQHQLGQMEAAKRAEFLQTPGHDPADLPPANPPASNVSMPNDPKAGLARLYQSAVASENAINETFRSLSAIELALIQKMPLAQARKLTPSDTVSHPAPSPALDDRSNPSATNDAIQAARAEINAMRSHANSLLARARSYQNYGSRSQNGADVASDDDPAGYGDGSGLLPGSGDGGTTPGNRGGAGKGSRSGQGNRGGNRGGSGIGNGYGKGNGEGNGDGNGNGYGTGSGNDLVPGFGSGPGAGGGVGTSEGGSDDSVPSAISGLGGGSGALGHGVLKRAISPEAPNTSTVREAMPGRVVASRGDGPRWMFVDSWYVLGPFDDTGRAFLEKKFGPEDIVDRDATFEGKLGARIRWEFYQAADEEIELPFRNFTIPGRPSTNPLSHEPSDRLEYIIYYAYTELRFEEACDLWVAFGSDDSSKAWLNDQSIWVSGLEVKEWGPTEGIRKIHFNKGINRLLFRVENAWGPTAFSMIIAMP